MQVGDLVTIKSHVQPPHLYGIGLVLDIRYEVPMYTKLQTQIKVRWSNLPDKVPMFLSAMSVDVVSDANR